jgi:hypothetical protein
VPTSLAVFDDDGPGADVPALYVGGSFSGAGLSNLARWMGSAWSSAGLGTDGLVTALAAWPAVGSAPGALFAVGSFSSAGGVSSGNVARLVGCSSCYANCDGSIVPPVLNVNDFICFQQRFAAGAAYANCDGSTIPPVLNVNDFICFQQHFATGCR